MVRYFNKSDREFYIASAVEFYMSPACIKSVPRENFERAFDECVGGSPFIRGVIIESNGILAGYGLVSITYSAEAGGQVIWLEELYIKEEFRSNGLGKEFFAFVYGEFPEARRFRLEVAPDNVRAAALYERLGYVPLNYDQFVLDK